MTSDSKRWTENLSEVEFERLKSYEYSGRLNEVLLEAFDFWTDVGLVAVLYAYSQPDVSVFYDDPIIGVLTSSGFSECDIGTTPPDRDQALFYSLFAAALVFLVINVIVRACIALYKIVYLELSEMSALKRYAYFIIGIVATIVSPHNGLFFLDTVVGRGTKEKDVVVFTKREIKLDALLLSMEDIPQFVVSLKKKRVDRGSCLYLISSYTWFVDSSNLLCVRSFWRRSDRVLVVDDCDGVVDPDRGWKYRCKPLQAQRVLQTHCERRDDYGLFGRCLDYVEKIPEDYLLSYVRIKEDFIGCRTQTCGLQPYRLLDLTVTHQVTSYLISFSACPPRLRICSESRYNNECYKAL